MEGSRAPPMEPGSMVLSYFVSTDGSGIQLTVLSKLMESINNLPAQSIYSLFNYRKKNMRRIFRGMINLLGGFYIFGFHFIVTAGIQVP